MQTKCADIFIFFKFITQTMRHYWLLLGAAGSFLVSALHIFVIAQGAWAYRYFGAGEEFARASEAGQMLPAIVTLIIVIIFAILGVYALAGAGVVRVLPYLRAVVLFTGVCYTLRGLVLFAELAAQLNIFAWRDGVRPQDPVFSGVSLLLGVVHLVGWYFLRKGLL
jgi:hypothetical protein